MKLSEIKGEDLFEVLADIIDPIANIAEDEAAAVLFKREKLPEGMTVKQALVKRVRKAVPTLLKGHKRDLITILARVNLTDPDAYAGVLTLPKLLKDTVDLLTDEAFTGLFISAQTETGGESSGSAQENTTESDEQSLS